MSTEQKDCIVKFGYFKAGSNTGLVEIVNVTTNKTLRTFMQSRSDHFSSNGNKITIKNKDSNKG